MAETRQDRETAPRTDPKKGESEATPGEKKARTSFSPEQRHEILHQLFFEGAARKPFVRQFYALLAISIIIATVGLLLVSTAVVIGAMLLSPLLSGFPKEIHRSAEIIARTNPNVGDLQMMQWVSAGNGPRFCLYVHHTDADREWSYDRQSHIGRLDKGLDEAKAKGWTVVDMTNDRKSIYPLEQR